ncbi:amino acid transporter LysE [Pseudarthrobacter polychromogenes]|uniref:Amino acid transporter LysE n=1 Tax=Pseudarthrobacter polychromogenes TaxID=1676 RepID=A0ABQ1Y3L6_9MICC|nr:amino acid transporter LysE [Pseudarthrobacter polychromogenes]
MGLRAAPPPEARRSAAIPARPARKAVPVDTSNYLALLGVAVILAITPGPDTLLTLQYALRRRSAGIFVAVGSASGIFVWAGLVAAGVAAFLQDSPVAFHTLRVLGGAYLFYLGYRALTTHTRTRMAARKSVAAGSVAGAQGPRASTLLAVGPGDASADTPAGDLQPGGGIPTRWSAFGAGVLCCLTNPKTGLFFLALIPQFSPTGAGPLYVVAVVGGTVAAVIGSYLAVVALGAHTAGTWLNRPAVTQWIHCISGVVFIALGLTTSIPVVTALL